MSNKIFIFFSGMKNFIKDHHIWSIIIAVVIIGGGYYAYGKFFPTASTIQYTYGRVIRGDLIVSVTGSGQVSTLSKISIKPTTTGQTQTLGQIISVKVKNGDTVKAGQVVAILDGKNALQTLNQAEASVTSAQASYDKLVSGLTDSQLLSLNNAITTAQTSLDNAKQNILIKLKGAYTTASNSVYLNTDSFFTNPMGNNQLAVADVNFVNQQLQNNVEQGRYTIGPMLNNWREKIINQKISDDLVSSINSALSDLNVMRNYFDDMTMLFAVYSIAPGSSGQSSIDSNKSTSASARSSIDSLISDLTSTLQSYNNSIISLQQAKDNLSVQQKPPLAADLAVSKANLDNAKANLANAETAYASRIITAPFDGQIGGLTADVGQQVSSSDSLGTLITSEKVINVTLNEVDAAKVSAGNSVIITFDSLPNVSITGHVGYIDPLGTVTQGVVSYSVQIKMDEQNNLIKTAMTASVSIVTTQQPNTLIIPISAVTTIGGKKYVLVADTSSTIIKDFDLSSSTRNFASTSRGNFASTTFASTTKASSSRQFGNYSASNTNSTQGISVQYTITEIEITTGISNNTMMEVLSGLSEGQLIVTKKTTIKNGTTVTKTTAASATTNTRGGFGDFGGGAVGATMIRD
ncbi:MAG: HlyD family efflux transporter periplasmic adaptor subunit [Candidatus Paceibacterota bacterium]|jgi:multidrug efflux pump subunit AcrA (membrane-fusion protein)